MFQKVLHLLLLAAPPAQQESSDMLPSSFSSHVSRLFLICVQEKAENEEADSGQRCRRPSAALRKTTQVWLYAASPPLAVSRHRQQKCPPLPRFESVAAQL